MRSGSAGLEGRAVGPGRSDGALRPLSRLHFLLRAWGTPKRADLPAPRRLAAQWAEGVRTRAAPPRAPAQPSPSTRPPPPPRTKWVRKLKVNKKPNTHPPTPLKPNQRGTAALRRERLSWGEYSGGRPTGGCRGGEEGRSCSPSPRLWDWLSLRKGRSGVAGRGGTAPAGMLSPEKWSEAGLEGEAAGRAGQKSGRICRELLLPRVSRGGGLPSFPQLLRSP